MQLYALPEAIGSRLDEDVPLNVAQRVVGRGAVPPVVLEELFALLDRGVEVADDVDQRRAVPSYLARVADAVRSEGLLGLGDDADEDVEIFGEEPELGAELCVLGSWVRATLATCTGTKRVGRQKAVRGKAISKVRVRLATGGPTIAGVGKGHERVRNGRTIGRGDCRGGRAYSLSTRGSSRSRRSARRVS